MHLKRLLPSSLQKLPRLGRSCTCTAFLEQIKPWVYDNAGRGPKVDVTIKLEFRLVVLVHPIKKGCQGLSAVLRVNRRTPVSNLDLR